MLDPLTALGLAASVVQFVDFSSTLFVAGRELYRAGDTSDKVDVKAISEDLIKLSHRVKTRLRPPSALIGCLSEDDQALEDLAEQCIRIADDLVGTLSKLTANTHGRRWKSFVQALKLEWNKDKIATVTEQLQAVRDEMQIRILVSLKTSTDVQAATAEERFNTLDESSRVIIQALSNNQAVFAFALDQQTAVLIQRQDDSEKAAQQRQLDLLLAIQNLQVATAAISTSDAANDVERAQERVLDCLSFRQITDRIDEVSVAYGDTFEWIFHASTSAQADVKWDNFSSWLENGAGCYWINGKAGSGKSTLMKRIYNDARTEKALSSWAYPRTLVIAAFFFWNSGSDLQKSQLGLLRALLHDILEQHPSLIPDILPGLYKEASIGERASAMKEPSFTELVRGVTRLSQQRIIPLKLCIFIDGVDEYQGDHAELVRLFKSLSSSSTVKLVLSSRPITACEEAFVACPKLRLQDLTSHDVSIYVEGKLGCHPRILQLSRNSPEAPKQLVQQIVGKARGVFLWVILMVKSLLEGLRDYDHFSDLKRRVDETPRELKDFYALIFQRLNPRYREDAARLIRVILEATQIKTLTLSFADEVDPTTVFQARSGPLTWTDALTRCQEIDGRLRSRCCGLFEVSRTRQRFPDFVQPHQCDNAIGVESDPPIRASRSHSPGFHEDFGTTFSLSPNGRSPLTSSVDRREQLAKLEEGSNHRHTGSAESSELNLDESPEHLICDVTFEEEMIYSDVVPLHKSIIEFLRDPDISDELVQMSNKADFNPSVSLLSAHLRQIKASEPRAFMTKDAPIFQDLQQCFKYAASAEAALQIPQSRYLVELDHIMSHQWSINPEGRYLNNFPAWFDSQHWISSVMFHFPIDNRATERPTLLALSAVSGLKLHVEHLLQYQASEIRVERANHVLVLIMECLVENLLPATIEDYTYIISSLLGYGAKPNADVPFSRLSAWSIALLHTYNLNRQGYARHRRWGLPWSRILELLVRHNANLKTSVRHPTQRPWAGHPCYVDKSIPDSKRLGPMEGGSEAPEILEQWLSRHPGTQTGKQATADDAIEGAPERLSALLAQHRSFRSGEKVQKSLLKYLTSVLTATIIVCVAWYLNRLYKAPVKT